MARQLAYDFDALGLDRAVWAEKLRKRVRVAYNGCWIWTGGFQNKNRPPDQRYGYMTLRIGPRSLGKCIKLPAHRLAFWVANPDVRLEPTDLVLHRCDHPPCIRPEHVRKGTHQENMRDVVKAGTQRGVFNGASVLSATQVLAIRVQRDRGTTLKALAERYGAHLSTIDLIVRGLSWPHVGGPIQQSRKRKGDPHA